MKRRHNNPKVSDLAMDRPSGPASAEQVKRLAHTAARAWNFVRAASVMDIARIGKVDLQFQESTGSAQLERLFTRSIGDRFTISRDLGVWLVSHESFLPGIAEYDDYGNLIVTRSNYPLSVTEPTSRSTFTAKQAIDGSLEPQKYYKPETPGGPIDEARAQWLTQNLDGIISQPQDM